MSAIAERSPTVVAEMPQRIEASTALMPANMDQAMRLADMMSKGKMVPQHLQGSPADCLMVIEQAIRWRMSPFAVAQCASSVRGKLMFEGKLVAAAVHTSGVLTGRLDYAYTGKGDELEISVTGTLRGESKAREIKLKIKDAKTENGSWTKQPEQQLVYAGTRVWARRHTPEVMLGVYVPEEDWIDAPPADSPKQSEEKPAYSKEQFDAAKGDWKKLIDEGKTMPSNIITKLQSKFTLTDEQKAAIENLKQAKENADAHG